MNAAVFELNVSLPTDARFAETMRELAAHAARYAGCRGADADLYAAAVQAVVADCLAHGIAEGTPLRAIVRRAHGPLEFLIACERRFETLAVDDEQIVIGWTMEAETVMCRVARLMPAEASNV